jgi:hypothetical protein
MAICLMIMCNDKGRLPGELPGDEVDADQDQRDAGDLVGALAPALGDPGADGQAQSYGQEGLHGDGRDHRGASELGSDSLSG